MKTRFENLILLLFTAIAVLAFAIVCMFVERAASMPCLP